MSMPAVKKAPPVRGDVYYADLSNDDSRGSEQSGNRPVVVLQNNIGNYHSPTTIVAMITSGKKRNSLPTHVTIHKPDILTCYSTVCLEQIKTIDQSRLLKYLGNLGPKIMQEIDSALSVSFGTSLHTEYPSTTSSLTGVERKSSESKESILHIPIAQVKPTVYDKKCTDWLEFAKNQLQFYQNAKQYSFNLSSEIDTINSQIELILTEVEDSHCNAAEGYHYYKLLREKRIQLRKIRNELTQLQIIINNLDLLSIGNAYQKITDEMESDILSTSSNMQGTPYDHIKLQNTG